MLFYVDRYTAVDQREVSYTIKRTRLWVHKQCVLGQVLQPLESGVCRQTHIHKYVLGQVDILKQHLGRGNNFCSPSQVWAVISFWQRSWAQWRRLSPK